MKKKITKIAFDIKAKIEDGCDRNTISRDLGLTGNTVNKWWDYWADKGVCEQREKGRSNPNPYREQILELMRTDHSDRAIYNHMKSLGVTRGVISGIRSRHHYPHRGDPGKYVHTPSSKFQPRMGEPFRQFLLANILATRQDDGNRMPLREPIPLEELRGWEHHAVDGPVPFDSLSPSMCKYPIGESDPHLFCGCERGSDKNYCDVHAGLIRDTSPEALRKIKSAMMPPKQPKAVKLPWKSDIQDIRENYKRKRKYD